MSDNINNSNPARGGQVVVPGTPFDTPARSLWVGTAGDVAVVFSTGQTPVVYTGVSGALPVQCVAVATAGTTASNITTLI